VSLVLALTLVACNTAAGPQEPDGGSDTEWTPPSCPAVSAPAAAGALALADIDELSGLAASGRREDLFWAHNDSGDSARFFALDGAGANLGTWALTGVTAVDWEDVARRGPPEASYLYFADMGDNNLVRHSITLWRVPEPEAPAGVVTDGQITPTGFVLTYPDGPHNAETLLADPLRDELFIVTKTASGASQVFRTPTLEATLVETLEEVAQLHFGDGALTGSPLATGGDVSPDGRWVVIVTYTSAFAWPRDPSQPLYTAFANPPCELPRASEPQGESVAFDVGNGALRLSTISEGDGSVIYRSTFAP